MISRNTALLVSPLARLTTGFRQAGFRKVGFQKVGFQLAPVALAAVACSGEGAPAEPDTTVGVLAAPVLSTCTDQWQARRGESWGDSRPPRELYAYEGDVVYKTEGRLIRFDPDAEYPEPATRVVATGVYSTSFAHVDGDELVFVRDQAIESVSLESGERRSRAALEALPPDSLLGAGSGEYFYGYSYLGADRGELFRVDARTGAIEPLAELEGSYEVLMSDVVTSGDGALVWVYVARAPLWVGGDGAVRPLTPPEASAVFYEALGPSGALSFVVALGTEGPSALYERQVWLSPADGAPATNAWPTKPPGAGLRSAWSDGGEGWFVETDEMFEDGYFHTSLWHLQPDGSSSRLACDPSRREAVMDAVTSSSASAFSVVSHVGDGYWELLEMPLER